MNRDPARKVDLDLPLIRKNLVRLVVVQAALLAIVAVLVLVLRPPAPRAWPLAWVGLLPVLVAAWAFLYWRALHRAKAADGGTFGSYQRANASSLRALGLLAAAWAIGLVAVLFLS